MRQRIAQEAARLIDEHALRDYQHAKRKAAEHLAAPETRHLPTNEEIEAALDERHRLFMAEQHPETLTAMRHAAVDAMYTLAAFQPRLVGPVLSGTAGEHTPITLHVFTDSPEDLPFLFLDHNLPFEEGEIRVRPGGPDPERELRVPLFRLTASEGLNIEVVVLPQKGLRQAPRSPVDGRPMERATTDAVVNLLTEGSDDSSPR